MAARLHMALSRDPRANWDFGGSFGERNATRRGNLGALDDYILP
jgi:hypothetical protein